MGCERVRIWIWCRRNKRESLGQRLSGSHQEHGWEVRICHLSWWRSGKRRRTAWTAHWNRNCCTGYGRGWCKVWWARWIGKTIWIVWWRRGVVIKRYRNSWWYNGTRTRAGFWVVNRWRCWCFFSGKRWWWWNGTGTGVGYRLVDSRWRRWVSLWFEALCVLNVEESLVFFWRKSHVSTRVGEALPLFIITVHIDWSLSKCYVTPIPAIFNTASSYLCFEYLKIWNFIVLLAWPSAKNIMQAVPLL